MNMKATKKRYVHLMLYFSPTQQEKETKFCERSSSKSIRSDGMGYYIYIYIYNYQTEHTNQKRERSGGETLKRKWLSEAVRLVRYLAVGDWRER